MQILSKHILVLTTLNKTTIKILKGHVPAGSSFIFSRENKADD